MANDHNLPLSTAEVRARDRDALSSYVSRGGVFAVPVTSLILASVATDAYIVEGPAGQEELAYVSQPSESITFPAVNGEHWVGIDTSTTAVRAGWTRPTFGAHYLIQQVATEPAVVDSILVLTRVTVAGGVITAVSSVANRVPFVDPGAQSLTAFGGLAGQDNTASLQKAFAAGVSLRIPAGTFLYKSATPLAMATAGTALTGDGFGGLIRWDPPAALGSITRLVEIKADNIRVNGVAFDTVTDTAAPAPTNGIGFNYLANSEALFVALGVDNTTIDQVRLTGYARGVTTDQTTTRVKLTNSTLTEMGINFTAFFICNDVLIHGNTFTNVGTNGGVVASSCHKVRVTSNELFAAGSTGVNLGGSGAADLETKEAVVANNTIFAQNAIAIENGVQRILIVNNAITITEPNPNGTGIGINSSLTTGSQSGLHRSIRILGNSIEAFGVLSNEVGTLYGEGIKVLRSVGTSPTTPDDTMDVTIADNVILHATLGISFTNNEVASTNRYINIHDNTVRYVSTGISVFPADNVTIARNYLRGFGAVLQSGTVGILLDTVTNATIEGNITESFFNGTYPGGHYAIKDSTLTLRDPDARAASGSTFGNFATESGTNVLTFQPLRRQGSSVLSAGVITLPADGDFFEVIGNVGPITNLVPPVSQPFGLRIWLQFQSNPTINDEIGNPTEIELVGSNFTVAVGQTMSFIFRTQVGDQWMEVSRSAP